MTELTKEEPKKANDGAGLTRMARHPGRLGVKAKRRHVSQRFQFCKTQPFHAPPNVSLLSPRNDLFNTVIGLGLGESASTTAEKSKAGKEQKLKQRSFLDVSKEEEQHLEEHLMTRGAKERLIPTGFEVNSHVVHFLLANLAHNASNLLEASHALFCLVQFPQHARDVATNTTLVKSMLGLLKKNEVMPNRAIVWFTCATLERLLFEEDPKATLKATMWGANVGNVIATIMRVHAASDDVQVVCCKLLWAVSEGDNLSSRKIDSTLLNEIFRAMDNFPDHDGVQYEACTLLQRLSVLDENEGKVGGSGGIGLVLKTALNPALDNEVVKKAFAALWNLSFDDYNKNNMINTLKAQEKILNVIKRFSDSGDKFNYRPDIVSKACGVLWNLADFVDGKQTLIESNVPEQIVETMSKFRFDAKVQEMGCGCLRSLAYDDKARIGLMQIGAAEKILQSMKDHVTNQAIQYQAFAVLKKLSCNDVNEGRLIKMQAGERILEAMDAHLDIPSIQERACGVLWNLAVNDGHKVRLVSIGCAEKMLKAMERHQAVEAVQYQTCRTLKRLARDSDNEVHLMRLGAARHVLTAMKSHLTNHTIQEKGCGVLWNLSERDEHKRQLMELGAAQQILESMKSHLDKENVQYEACGALKRLAVDDRIEVQLMEMNAAKFVLEAMANHVAAADVQGQGCGVLWNLAFNGQQALMNLRAAQQILVAMETHPTNDSVQEKACGTLWKLAEIEENNEALMKLSIVTKVLSAMDNLRGQAGVQYQACGTLWNLAVRECNREPLLVFRAEERVLRAMKIHKGRQDILHSACGVLFNLATTSFKVTKQIGPGCQVGVNNRLLLAHKGAVTCIVQCMRAHPDHAEVVFQAMAALRYIAEEPTSLAFFNSDAAVLSQIIFSAILTPVDAGILDNAVSLASQLMATVSESNEDFDRQLKRGAADSSMEVHLPEEFMKISLDALLKVSRGQALNTQVQKKAVTFFSSLYKYVARSERSLVTVAANKGQLKRSGTVQFLRKDSDLRSSFSSVTNFRRSFLCESFDSTTTSSSFGVAFTGVTTKARMTKMIDRLAAVCESTRMEETTQMAALSCLNAMFTDFFSLPSSPLFGMLKGLLVSVPAVVAGAVTIFQRNTVTLPTRMKALKLINNVLVSQKATNNLVEEILNDTNFFQSLELQLETHTSMEMLTTFQILLFRNEVSEPSRRLQLIRVFVKAVHDLFREACVSVSSKKGVKKGILKLQKCLLLMRTISFDKKTLYNEFIKAKGFGSLLETLRVAVSSSNRLGLTFDVLDVLQDMLVILPESESLLLKPGSKFLEVLSQLNKIQEVVLVHQLQYLPRKKQQTVLKKQKSYGGIFKRGSDKVEVVPEASTLQRNKTLRVSKENLQSVGLILLRTVSFINTLLAAAPNDASVVLQVDGLVDQINFIAHSDTRKRPEAVKSAIFLAQKVQKQFKYASKNGVSKSKVNAMVTP